MSVREAGESQMSDHAADGTAEPNGVVLDIVDLQAGYGEVPVLHGVSLQLWEGEAIGIVGHNGMGKTTLMKAIVGLLPARGGKIVIDGSDVTGWAAHERSRLGISYMPQGRGILPGLSAHENLRLAWTPDSGETEERAIERVLSLFPRLTRLLERRGGALSGGEQQILALARALVPVPWLLLLDEPSEGIQPSIVQEIGELLASLREKHRLSMLIVEQNLELVLDVASRIVLVERGRITRELDVGAMQGGAIAELVGLGGARSTYAGTSGGVAARPRPQLAVVPSANTSSPAPANRDAVAAPAAVRSSTVARATSSSASARNGRSRIAAPATPADVTSLGGPMSTVRRPTLEQMHDIVDSLHLSMSTGEVAEYLEVLEGTFQAYDRVNQLPDYLPPVRYPRTPGYRPGANENPLNAWAVKAEVRGAAHGPLSGKRIVLKDNICLAGVPMMNGASTLEGYVPDIDATVVTRILDAGGTIVGKAHCEYFCLSGGSHTSAHGPVHNPFKLGYSAGGSSSGCGALVGAGEVEMAIGGDQGGSIRMPAAYSGCYGMKATHGLVPYTGIMPIEATIDHAGPMTTTVADNALLLEVIAGADGLDPRQYDVQVEKYSYATGVGRGVSGMRIGLVQEGFGWPASEPDVEAKVREAAERLRGAGAIVEPVSIPMHRDGGAIWTPIALEGLVAQMMSGNGMGFNWKGLYTTSLLDAHANWRARADELSRTLKISMLAGEYFIKHHRGHFYAKAQNLGRLLRKTYDDALARYDLLMMPTLPLKATPLPPNNAPLALWCQRGFEMLPNTAPFDVTGHPAMNIPCGMSDGLPIGMMLVGKHYAETTIYRAAHAFEQFGDWRNF
jgi:amidase